MTIQFGALLRALVKGKVKFIIMGGVAGAIHGSAKATNNLEVVYSRDPKNIERLVAVLTPLDPYLRGAPPGLPFTFNSETIRSGLNFTLVTTLGSIDLFGEVAGGGTYVDLIDHSSEIELSDVRCFCVDIGSLIQMKQASGRPRDLEVIAELRAILAQRPDR